MSSYDNKPHLGCACTVPGALSYEKDIVEQVIMNKRDVKRYGVPPKTKEVTKSMYSCNKCNELVNIVSCPSWEDYVLSGKIRVAKYLYWELRNARDKRYKKEQMEKQRERHEA